MSNKAGLGQLAFVRCKDTRNIKFACSEDLCDGEKREWLSSWALWRYIIKLQYCTPRAIILFLKKKKYFYFSSLIYLPKTYQTISTIVYFWALVIKRYKILLKLLLYSYRKWEIGSSSQNLIRKRSLFNTKNFCAELKAPIDGNIFNLSNELVRAKSFAHKPAHMWQGCFPNVTKLSNA